MTQAQVTPPQVTPSQNSSDDISEDESTSIRRVTTITRSNVLNFLFSDEACPKWGIPYLYSIAEDYMLVRIEILETIIDSFNCLAFLKFMMDCLGSTQVETVLDRHQLDNEFLFSVNIYTQQSRVAELAIQNFLSANILYQSNENN